MKTQVIFLTAVLLAVGGCTKDDTPRGSSASKHDGAQLAKSTDGPAAGKLAQTDLEVVANFTGPMPTGVAVSHDRRIFVNFPRWGDPVEFTVAEVKQDGSVVPYPDLQTNKGHDYSDPDKLVSVQSVVVDPKNRLWILDTASINFQPNREGFPKLVAYDLKTNQRVKTIHFPPDVALATTYLNDVRFNLEMGEEGMAFITDSSDSGPNAIIVVDLASGKARRRLNDHPSTKAETNFQPNVEGRPLMARPPGKPEAYMKIGADGIAISGDGKTMYYCPLAGRRLYRVSTEALVDPEVTDAELAGQVEDLGDRGFASDGLESDAQGRVYLTDYESNAIRVRETDGTMRVLVQDARLIWPDTLALSADRYLYVTANQLNRQARFHNGQDLRRQPYTLFRVKAPGTKVVTGAD
jgi:sugar lactone lactonase YvrE